MSEEQHSYKQIVKSTALFGGVQVIQILSTISRGKFVALFLGTTGIGINALLNSAIILIIQFSSLGINFSAVRDISQANEKGNSGKLEYAIRIFQRWTYCCIILGALVICIFAKKLSIFSFGNSNYTGTFMLASLVVVFTMLYNANITILQGRRSLKELARASLWSAVFGLLFCLPCYYFFKLDGILPAIICSAAVSFFISLYYSKRSTEPIAGISLRETFDSGTKMVKLGITMMFATLIGTATTYLFNIYIVDHGTIQDVGLYTAGVSITNQYIGVIFTAMSVDYFPKLAAVCTDIKKVNEIVNRQSEIVLLISAPLLIIMILSAPLIIRLLLSAQFLEITGFVYWTAFALLFKAASFAVGYISFAKGDKKTFFIFEGVLGASLILSTNIIGYKLGGITGTAKGMLIAYVIYIIAVNFMANRMYGFRLEREVILMLLKLTALLGSALFFVLQFSGKFGYMLGCLSLVITLYYSYTELNKRIGLQQLILSRFRK